ncbi:helix-turn-helix domain-containing protein [Amycolatopsis thailandensis]|uniref:helix-turn-helix domain-containing protein n=1 Tax=Amycolatopsis thailandensis TaxID=589330 RepID=UPI0036626AED
MTDDSPRVSASALDPVDGGAALAASIRELASAIRALGAHAPRDPDALLTAEDVGALPGLSPRTLKDRAAAGVFPHRRFGKHYRFSREDGAEIVQLTKSEVRPDRGGMRAA